MHHARVKLIKYACDLRPLETPGKSSVSEVIEEIRKFSFSSALNELYFAVWVSPVVQSSDCTHPVTITLKIAAPPPLP